MFELFRKKDMNQGVEEWKNTKGAVLLDVRTTEEYREYHIDGSINIPLQSIDDAEMQIPDKNQRIYVHCLSGVRSANAEMQIPDKNQRIYVHCLSGVRSANAVRSLKKSGYSDVIDIGGINSYRKRSIT